MDRRTLAASVLLVLLGLAACGQATSPDATSPDAISTVTTSNPATADVFCEEIGRRVSQTDCDDLAHVAQSAEAGLAAFNAPAPMQRGDATTLQLAISYAPPALPPPAAATSTSTDTTPPAETATGVDGAHPTPSETVSGLPGETREFTPLVGRFMHAELTGAGFDIRPLSPATQEVARDSVTTWNWQVTARQGGVQPLTLTTVVEGCLQGGECIPLRTTTRNYTVKVQVSAWASVRDTLVALPDWIKLLTAVITALTGLILALFALRRAFRRGRRDA